MAKDLNTLSEKEKKEYAKTLRDSQSKKEKRIKIIFTTVIFGVLALAAVGVYVLSGSSNSALPKELGEKIAIDPTTGQQHIDVGAAHAPYSSNPPTSGPHYAVDGYGPIECKFFDGSVADEGVIHNLEHGAIWISYKNKNDTTLKEGLKKIFDDNSKIVVSHREANDSNIAVAGWGRLLKLDSFDQTKIEQFIKLYKNGPEVPEPLAGCGTHTR